MRERLITRRVRTPRTIRYNPRSEPQPSRYGLGKFDLNVDAWLHQQSLDGTDEEIGDVQDFGWYGLMKGPFNPTPSEVEEFGLTDDDLAFLRKYKAGAIISEDDQGFVSVEWYSSKKALMKDWKKIESRAEEYYEEAEEEDYGDYY